MTDDYDRGKRDGLRLALAVLNAEEAKWAEQLGQSRSWRTNHARELRHKTLQVAQRRIATQLGRMKAPSDASLGAELAGALDKLGL